MRAMPELHTSLDKYQGGLNGVDNRGNLVASLRDLFGNLSKVSDGFPPLVFWQVNNSRQIERSSGTND
jgi:ubiquitin carboxyl-terminal hydrolase 14